MKKRPLLSVCIPTYNRAEYLNQTLKSIVESDCFDEKTEIVVSDNCSNDNTEDICSIYVKKHPNIKYIKYQQPINLNINLIEALSLGTGHYIKLNNDTVAFASGTLQFFLNKIKDHLNDKSQLLFVSSIHNENFLNRDKFYNKNNKSYISENLDDFIDILSTSITWISNFGCWKEQFENISDKTRFIDTFFLQVDWSLKMRIEKGIANIYMNDFYILMNIKKTGSVNFIDIHCNKYLSIYQYYLEQNLIKKETFEKEKKRTLFNVVVPITAGALVFKNSFYSLNGFFYNLKWYKKNLYFYFAVYLFLPCYIMYLAARCILTALVRKSPYEFYMSIKKRINAGFNNNS